MNKKEKIIAIFLSLSIILLIISAIFTIFYNKPQNYHFRVEKILKKI